MKKTFIVMSVLVVLAFGVGSAIAQCDRTTQSPIRCGYYDEGYQDGVADANTSRGRDYRRYRSKFENQYESFYRNGYEAGYDSGRPTGNRWTGAQRNAYDSGYDQGQNDRRRSGSGIPEPINEGRFDPNIGLYYQQGYDDGFANRPRRYDFSISGGGTGYPPNPGGTGASWSGRVDGRANIIIRDGSIRTEDVSGSGLQVRRETMNGSLPRRSATVSAQKVDGRGDVRVIQQPNRSNDYTAIIEVNDPRSGAGDYNVEISWTRSGGAGGGGGGQQEPYQSGSVRWRGRVDQTATITIFNGEVRSDDASGTGLWNPSYDLTGHLPLRSVTVSARKQRGRGNVTVLQQPSWENDFTAIVQVFDPGSGADNYEVEITW